MRNPFLLHYRLPCSPKERKYGLKTVLLWVTALLLLSLLYFAFVRALDRNRQKQLPSSPAATGASTPPPSTRPAFSKPEGGANAIPPVAAYSLSTQRLLRTLQRLRPVVIHSQAREPPPFSGSNTHRKTGRKVNG